jgi:hypothetical protein
MADDKKQLREMDKMIRKVVVTLSVAILSSLVYITYAAGETKKQLKLV